MANHREQSHSHLDLSLSTPGPTRRSLWRRFAASTAFRLAVFSFVVYQLNFRSISSADTFPNRYLPISILTEFDLDLDEFPFLAKEEYAYSPSGAAPSIPYYLQKKRGHYMSTYPVMPAILATPIYVIPVLLGLTRDTAVPLTGAGGFTRTEVVGTMLSKIAASTFAAVSVALVYLTLCRLAGARGAIWLTLGYAFATSLWAVASQGLWQSSATAPLLSGAFLALLVARQSPERRMLSVAGTLLALAVMCRPPAIIIAAALSVYVWRHHRQGVVLFAIVPVVLGGVLLLYNLYYFGTLMGGYEGYTEPYVFTVAQVRTSLSGLLISPNRGLLVFSPVLALSFVGMVVVATQRTDPLLPYVTCAVILTIALYSTYAGWHGAFSYSYRLMMDAIPAFPLLAAPVWHWLAARRERLALMGVLAAYSVGIQVVGVFFYPCGWYRSSQGHPEAISRYFDWTDLEVVRCIQAGPVYPDGFRLLDGAVRKPPDS